MRCADVLVIRVERYRITVAAFSGIRLDYVQVRALSSIDYEVARRSARRFVRWAIRIFQPTEILLEQPGPREGLLRNDLRTVVDRALALSDAGRIRLPSRSGFHAFGLPERSTRTALHLAGRRVWPELAKRHGAAVEAAALGLHYQMFKLLYS